MHRVGKLLAGGLFLCWTVTVLMTVGCGSGGTTTTTTTTPTTPTGPNQSPVITTTYTPSAGAETRDQPLGFSVTVTDPDGDVLELRLMNAPAGAVFSRKTGTGTVTGAFHWEPGFSEKRWQLEFRATDGVGNSATLMVEIEFEGNEFGSGSRSCDVTGDGIRDLVVGAREADANATDDGAIYVFQGGPTPAVTPTARLAVPGAANGDRLGDGLFICCDVTGDGIADIVAAAETADVGVVDSGAVYVFVGGPGLTGTVAPTATLVHPSPTAGDSLGRLLDCCDVTGDGTPDVITSSGGIDVAGVLNAGAGYIWEGGAGLVGTPAPTATLRQPTPLALNALGGTELLCCDVTGDGRADVLLSSAAATTAGGTNSGVIEVWAGGAISGTPPPTATLNGQSNRERIGRRIRCCDVTGDATPDIVAPGPSGLANAGAIRIWSGGTGLSGVVSPSANLVRATPLADDGLGSRVLCCDVTGDGRRDVIALAPQADVGGVMNVGESLIWAGGAGLSGTPAPTATLRIPSPTAGDVLGRGLFPMVLCRDVTGDGVNDVVLPASEYDGTVADEGAIFVWAGGAALTGMPAPTARLARAAPTAADLFTRTFQILCRDVTGDGYLDVVTGCPYADVGGEVDSGEVVVHAGGPGMTGVVLPAANLRNTTPQAGQGFGGDSEITLWCRDVSGDGVLDVVVGGASADVGGQTDAGEIRVWRGGAGLAGTLPATAVLRASSPAMGDQLGVGWSTMCADLDDDGVLDILSLSTERTVGATVRAGAVYFWKGGAALVGTLSGFEMARSAPEAHDTLGSTNPPLRFSDLTGDGRPDLLTGSQVADVGGVMNVGMMMFWEGGAAPTATPTGEMTVPGAVAGDGLGR